MPKSIRNEASEHFSKITYAESYSGICASTRCIHPCWTERKRHGGVRTNEAISSTSALFDFARMQRKRVRRLKCCRYDLETAYGCGEEISCIEGVVAQFIC